MSVLIQLEAALQLLGWFVVDKQEIDPFQSVLYPD